MEMKGWAGRILFVDLSSGKVSKEPLRKEWKESFLGGHALAARLAYDLVKPGIDPLSTGNPKFQLNIVGTVCWIKTAMSWKSNIAIFSGTWEKSRELLV